MPLKVGQKAPDFSVPSTSGKIFTLSKTAAGKGCILFFYPKNFTRGCTAEACEFRDGFEEFKDLDIDVFGISTDSLDSHLRFKETYRLPFDLLADQNGKVAELFKALIPVVRVPRRVTFLLDKEHTVAAVYESMFMAKEHVKNMIAEVNSR